MPHIKKQTVITVDKKDGHRFFFKCQNIQDKVDWLKAFEEGKNSKTVDNEIVILNKSSVGATRTRGNSLSPNDKMQLGKNEESKGENYEEDKDNNEFEVVSNAEYADAPSMNSASMVAPSPGPLSKDQVINKDILLEKLAEIFHQTKMLSNDSPVTNELVTIQNSINSVNVKLEKTMEGIQGDTEKKDTIVELETAKNEVTNMLKNVENLINSFEEMRGKVYPIAEKIALIQLEKNPYRIPGEPYKKVKLDRLKVSK